MFQIEDRVLLHKLRENLDSPKSQIMCDPESLKQVFKTYRVSTIHSGPEGGKNENNSSQLATIWKLI